MLIALVTACGLWGVSWMFGKKLDSAWGVLLPCAVMPLIALMKLSFSEWRVIMVIALLATVAMLYHKRLRHYLLLPSCLALAGGMAAISVNFGML
ncbi:MULTISPECIES: DUF1435 domain-containing protein [Erwinia]|jgi:hypothetical protein|uniref:DUF1435 domain-containing protein n=1 Tax=Erwinia TaxID=551 RepID=UPI0005A263FD|nr:MULTISPECIES: DUF1435 domain-containing protein [Erwinia]MBN7123554.1 hypothetical protein [Erwinia billingiae]PRB57092.1 DUF1435 domain-containing protein [Erwinia billingiae]QBR50319.1 DUF1435 domain-containing protein [Erwinia sp. QL-Z3]QEW33730.1 DUF1435 domain-containing protein [Erwinia billingiae]